MKYTSYLWNAPINTEQIGPAAILPAFVGLAILTGLYPGAMAMDGGRIIRLKYLQNQRKLRKLRYIKSVLRSLDRSESRENIELLKAA